MLNNKFFIAFLCLMLLAALAYNIHYFTNRGKGTVRERTHKAVETMDPMMLHNTGQPAKRTDSSLLRSIGTPSQIVNHAKQFSAEKKPWGRNPFLTPDEEMSIQLTSTNGDGEGKEASIIKGILIGEKQRVAIIDHTVVTEGDWIGAERVVRIDEDKVILTLGKSQRILTMKKSPVSIIAEETKHNEI